MAHAQGDRRVDWAVQRRLRVSEKVCNVSRADASPRLRLGPRRSRARVRPGPSAGTIVPKLRKNERPAQDRRSPRSLGSRAPAAEAGNRQAPAAVHRRRWQRPDRVYRGTPAEQPGGVPRAPATAAGRGEVAMRDLFRTRPTTEFENYTAKHIGAG